MAVVETRRGLRGWTGAAVTIATRRLTIAITLLAVGLLAPTVALARRHGHPARRPVSYAATAQRLATQLARAGAPGARSRALLHLLKGLDVGVYTPGGKAVQHGAERGVRDFYLYDFEVAAVADALGRHQSYGLSDLANLLSKAGGTTVTAGQLGTALHAGVRIAVARPADPTSLVPLLVRDLGRRDRPAVDLARSFSASTLRLDAAQNLLLTASFLGEALRRDSARVGGHAAVAQPDVAARAVTAGDGGACPQVRPSKAPSLGSQAKGAFTWWVKKQIGSVSTTLGRVFQRQNLTNNILAALHGSLLAASLRLKALDSNLATHYGPAGAGLAPDAGSPLDFRLQAVMLDDLAGKLGDRAVKCLALAGIKIPPQGAIPGVPVRWEYAQGDLLQHGSVSPEGTLPQSTTGGDGIAHLTFTPEDELIPGLGVDTHDTGVVDGIALWQDAFGNGPSVFGIKLEVNQYITPIYNGIRWDVGYHNQLGTLEVSSNRANHWDTTGPAPLDEHEFGSYAYGQHALVPFSAAGGGSAGLTWTAFSDTSEIDFPNGSGQCYGTGPERDVSDGQNPQPGSVAVQQITGLPNISVTLGITPGSYNVHDVDTSGCGTSSNDGTATEDGGFRAIAGEQGVTAAGQNTYRIIGWTPGVPGSGVFATKTITLSDGTIVLKITPRFG